MPNRRQSLLLLGAGLAGTAQSASAAASDATQPLKLRLPFSSFNRDHERHLNLSKLFFVITNTSSERWGVWKDWCSWGWNCPKVVIDIRDRRFEFAKRARDAWKMNFPDPYYIEPDNHYILPVNLFDGDWDVPVGFNILHEVESAVSISFTISDQRAAQYKVWAGTLEYQTRAFLSRQ